MARQLWLLRHGEAEPHGTRADAERALTERGKRQARAAGQALRSLGVDFELFLYSPKVRARETAELAAEGLAPGQRTLLAEHGALAGGFDLAQARELLAGVGEDARVLLVGHEPDLSRLAGDLAGGLIDLKKGGLAVVRLEGPGGELVLLLRPRELAEIARLDGDG